MPDFFKKYWKLLAVILLLLLCTTIAIPLIINLLFKHPAPHEFWEAEWQAADALSYYGGVLSLFSTSAFSVLALWQNHEINEASKKSTALLEQMEREKSAPSLIVHNCFVLGNATSFSLVIKNVSENMAQNLSFSDFAFVDASGKVYWRSKNVHTEQYLAHNMTKEIHISSSGVKDAQTRLIFKISYVDVFGVSHKRCAVSSFIRANSNLDFIIQRINK